MADDERLRLRSTVADLLSPAQVDRDARGTGTVHDEPVVGGGVNGYAGQDGSNAEGPADVRRQRRPARTRYRTETHRSRGCALEVLI